MLGMTFQATFTGTDTVAFYLGLVDPTIVKTTTVVSVRQIDPVATPFKIYDASGNIEAVIGDPVSRNVRIGYCAGGLSPGAKNNIYIGPHTGTTSSGTGDTCSGNTCIGWYASCGSGSDNICFNNNGQTLTTGSFNIFLGLASGSATTGNDNICIGHQAGMIGINEGSNNILIGNAVAPPVDGTSNYLNIGNVILGDMATPGSITVAADPVVPLGIATKQYFDAVAGGGGGGGLPAGPVDSVQFNSAGVFGGSANFVITAGGVPNVLAAANNAYQYGGDIALHSTNTGFNWFFGKSAGTFTSSGDGNIGIGRFICTDQWRQQYRSRI
jgi:hypothetical protein